MPSHEHQWTFAGEVVIPTSTNEIHGDPFNRLEYCVECGAFRIRFGQNWRYWYSNATKKFLDQFTGETHRVLKTTPQEFKLGPPVREERRLGCGLTEIQSRLPKRKGLLELFKKGQ